MVGRQLFSTASPKRRVEEREQVLAVLLALEVLLVKLHLELDLRHPTSAQRTTGSGHIDRKPRKKARKQGTKTQKQTNALSFPSTHCAAPPLPRVRASFLSPSLSPSLASAPFPSSSSASGRVTLRPMPAFALLLVPVLVFASPDALPTCTLASAPYYASVTGCHLRCATGDAASARRSPTMTPEKTSARGACARVCDAAHSRGPASGNGSAPGSRGDRPCTCCHREPPRRARTPQGSGCGAPEPR